jgi:hypothetical protein
MEFDFSEIMSKHTDIELVNIVTSDRYKYQENALLAAENELAKRKIDPHNFILPETQTAVSSSTSEVNPKVPSKGNVFTFVIGLFLVLVCGINIFITQKYDWKEVLFLFWALYIFWQHGFVKDNSHWKFKPIKIATITVLVIITIIGSLYYLFLLPERSISNSSFQQKMEAEFSKRLPFNTENGRIDSIAFLDENNLKYVITLNVNADEFDSKKFDSIMKPAAIINLKNNKQLDQFFKLGYNFTFYYKDSIGNPISKINISNSELK